MEYKKILAIINSFNLKNHEVALYIPLEDELQSKLLDIKNKVQNGMYDMLQFMKKRNMHIRA